MTNPFFQNSNYKTPENTPRFFSDRLLLQSRWVFYYKFIRIVFKYRKFALKGVYSDEIWSDSSVEVLNTMEKCGARFDVSGLDQINAEKDPVVFISNHMSTTESMVLPGMISPYKKVTFVVKQSLIKDPVFGPVMRSREPVVVNRVDPRSDMTTVLNEGAERISRGYSVIIFPEGTRQDSFHPENFNSLGIKLAKKTGVKVVPIALKTDFWGNGRWLKEWGPLDRNKKIFFRFGNPISIEGNGKAAHLSVIEFIKSNMHYWVPALNMPFT